MCEHNHCNHEHGHCNHGEGCHGEGHHCEGRGEHHCQGHGEGHCGQGQGCGRGGRREGAGRKCDGKRIPFNRRLSEEAIQRIKDYAAEHNITETEALEVAVKKLIFEARNRQ